METNYGLIKVSQMMPNFRNDITREIYNPLQEFWIQFIVHPRHIDTLLTKPRLRPLDAQLQRYVEKEHRVAMSKTYRSTAVRNSVLTNIGLLMYFCG